MFAPVLISPEEVCLAVLRTPSAKFKGSFSSPHDERQENETASSRHKNFFIVALWLDGFVINGKPNSFFC